MPSPEIFSVVDDKHVPLYRVLWVSDVPHFCGNDDCQYEGRYEVRLEADESIFGTREERDAVIDALESWHGGSQSGGYEGEADWPES